MYSKYTCTIHTAGWSNHDPILSWQLEHSNVHVHVLYMYMYMYILYTAGFSSFRSGLEQDCVVLISMVVWTNAQMPFCKTCGRIFCLWEWSWLLRVKIYTLYTRTLYVENSDYTCIFNMYTHTLYVDNSDYTCIFNMYTRTLYVENSDYTCIFNMYTHVHCM